MLTLLSYKRVTVIGTGYPEVGRSSTTGKPRTRRMIPLSLVLIQTTKSVAQIQP